MSVENLNALARKAKDDVALQNALKACKSPAEVVGLASQHGFAISEAELQSAVKASQSKDLSDEQLDAVSGGVWELAVIGALVGFIVGAVVGGAAVNEITKNA